MTVWASVKQRVIDFIASKSIFWFTKQMQLIVLLYATITAILRAVGVKPFLGSLFIPTLPFLILALSISLSPKGLKYFSNYFRYSLILSAMPMLINQCWKLGLISDYAQPYVILAIISSACISYFIGLIIGHNEGKRKR